MVEKVTEVTGIKAAVEKLTDDCGCQKRKATLNKLVPFPRREFTKMDAKAQLQWRKVVLPEWERGIISGPVKKVLADMYLDAYHERAPHLGGCRSGCLARTLEEMEQVYMQSCDGEE